MNLFYYPAISGKLFILDKSESAHCTKVLRLKKDDIIFLTDGKGNLYKARITDPDRKACVTEILDIKQVPPERDYVLQIAIAPTKNIDRFEWFIEKATEFGIDTVIPMICNNSERRFIKEDRLRKVTISAIKQSLKARLPEIKPMTAFSDVISYKPDGAVFIATGLEKPENHLGRLYDKGTDAMILIGPEGDFSMEELTLSKGKGFVPVSLGRSRLRTETAGLAACHTVNMINAI